MDITQAMITDICGVDMFTRVMSILTVNPSTEFAAVWNVCQSIHHLAIKPIAIMLLFLYFCITIVDKMTQEHFSWDQLWRTMVMLLASKFLIDHAMEIMATMYSIGLAVIKNVDQQAESLAETNIDMKTKADQLAQEYVDQHFSGVFTKLIGKLLFTVLLILPWVATWACKICIYVVCYTRLLEFFIRTMFAPVALADFFHSGLQGAGWRFLKNYFAICLQGAVILAISVIFSSLMMNIINNTTGVDSSLFTYFATGLGVTFSGVALIFKSLSLTKELFGSA